MAGRFRMFELLKILVSIALGYSIRVFVEYSQLNMRCDEPTQCPQLIVREIADEPQLNEPFKPKTMFEVLRYEYFNSSQIFDMFEDDPKINLLGHQRADIKDIVSKTMAMFNSANHGSAKGWTMDSLVNGYRRIDGLRGEEYILDMYISAKDDTKRKELWRFELVKPFGVVQQIRSEQLGRPPPDRKDTMIHIIFPVTSKIFDRFGRYMRYFEDVILSKSNTDIYFLVILFTGKTDVDKSHAAGISNITKNLSRKYKHAHIRVIETGREFSRALGLDLGAKQLPGDALMFFCDADVTISLEFLHRCRYNAIEGERVYYPVVFAQYDPNITGPYSPKDKVKDPNDINKYTGHWVHYGYGMACMFNSDYRRVGGFDLNRKGWGGEDVELYVKHVKSDLKVFRAMDPDLIHIYHEKKCDPNLTADQLRMCVDSQAEGIGSRTQLAKKILSAQYKLVRKEG